MEQDFKKIDVKRCYACIQWDGQRTWYPEKRLMKVAENSEANCRVFHERKRGSASCEHFMPIG